MPHTKVPVQAIILHDRRAYPMFRDLQDYTWVLEPYRYKSKRALIANLVAKIIRPAEQKVLELKAT